MVNTLFDRTSNTSRRIMDYIAMFRDNLPDSLSNAEARDYIRDSVKVQHLQIRLPGGLGDAPLYSLYLHPPTAQPAALKRWRTFIAEQRFHAGNGGVGIKYDPPFRCLHCKTIDHPSGLCPHFIRIKGNAHGRNDVGSEDDLLPTTADPTTRQQNPASTRNGGTATRGNRGPPNRRNGTRGRGSTNAVRTSNTKRRKIS